MLSKRLTAFFFAVLLLSALPPVSAAAAETAQYSAVPAAALTGDADGDGQITIADATVIQRYIAEQPEGFAFDAAFLRRADTDGDNSVGIADATNIQCFCAEFAAGRTGVFPLVRGIRLVYARSVFRQDRPKQSRYRLPSGERHRGTGAQKGGAPQRV